jgi:hypothetical protein
MFEAGLDAADEGYDAICIDTMSDSGANALRSMLDIPVITPGKASYLTALMLGNKFSVLTQWDGWIPLYKKGCQEYGLTSFLASIRSINVPPDVENLLGGKEEVVFPKLRDAGLQCVEDGADVICLGSTTMPPGPRISQRKPAGSGDQSGATKLQVGGGSARARLDPQPEGLPEAQRPQGGNDPRHHGRGGRDREGGRLTATGWTRRSRDIGSR